MLPISKGQMDDIRRLWDKSYPYCGPARRERALRTFIKRVANIPDPQLLTWREMVKVVNEIKNMRRRKIEADLETEKILLSNLTPVQLEMLNKFNPFRREREELIINLAERGVRKILLAKISGVSRVTIHEILKKGKTEGGRKNERTNRSVPY